MTQSRCVNEFRVSGVLTELKEQTYGGGKKMQKGIVKTELPDKNGPVECNIEFAFFGFMAERAKENIGAVVTITGQIQSKNGFTNLRTAQFVVDTPAVFGGGQAGEPEDDAPPDEEEIPF
jgi:hypothetical protein